MKQVNALFTWTVNVQVETDELSFVRLDVAMKSTMNMQILSI